MFWCCCGTDQVNPSTNLLQALFYKELAGDPQHFLVVTPFIGDAAGSEYNNDIYKTSQVFLSLGIVGLVDTSFVGSITSLVLTCRVIFADPGNHGIRWRWYDPLVETDGGGHIYTDVSSGSFIDQTLSFPHGVNPPITAYGTLTSVNLASLANDFRIAYPAETVIRLVAEPLPTQLRTPPDRYTRVTVDEVSGVIS